MDAKSSRQESHVIPLECRHRNLTANGCSPRQSIHSRDALLSLVPVPSVHVLHRTDIGLWWKTLTSKSPRLGTLEVSLQDPGLKKWLLQQKDTSPNFAFSPLFFKFLLLFRFLLFASSSAAFLWVNVSYDFQLPFWHWHFLYLETEVGGTRQISVRKELPSALLNPLTISVPTLTLSLLQPLDHLL